MAFSNIIWQPPPPHTHHPPLPRCSWEMQHFQKPTTCSSSNNYWWPAVPERKRHWLLASPNSQRSLELLDRNYPPLPLARRGPEGVLFLQEGGQTGSLMRQRPCTSTKVRFSLLRRRTRSRILKLDSHRRPATFPPSSATHFKVNGNSFLAYWATTTQLFFVLPEFNCAFKLLRI